MSPDGGSRAIAVVLAGVVLTLLALTFDASPLFVPGTGMIAIGTVILAWTWLSIRPVTITRRLEVERVVEEEPLEAVIEVRRGLLGLPGAELRDPLAHRPVLLKTPLSMIQGSRVAEVRIVTHFSRRGLVRVEQPSLIVRDPLSLVLLSRRSYGPAVELLVLPRTGRVRWLAAGGGARAERPAGRPLSEPMAAVDVDGLRPYRQGTPASRIHWPALARGAGLLERRLSADRDARPLIVLDARGAAPEELLDAAVRAAASLTLALSRAGGCKLLLPGERRALAVEPDLASWPAAHARLALVQGGPEARPPLLELATRLGPVFYVATQPHDRLPGGLLAPGRGAVVVVLPKDVGQLPSGRPSFEVMGCQGFPLRRRAPALEGAA